MLYVLYEEKKHFIINFQIWVECMYIVHIDKIFVIMLNLYLKHVTPNPNTLVCLKKSVLFPFSFSLQVLVIS